MLSPIQLRNRWIKKLNLSFNEDKVVNPQHNLDYGLEYRSCKDHWHVILRVSISSSEEGQEIPIGGDIEFEGTFSIGEDFPEDKRDQLICMNGGAILYGAIREIYNTMACRSFHGSLDLPTLDARSFLIFVKESSEKEECNESVK